MRMIREILRLYYSCGLSKKRISKTLGCARSSVADSIQRAVNANLKWPLPDEFADDDVLERRLYNVPEPGAARPQPDCNYIYHELKKKGVTLLLLWQEYKEQHPDGYQQTQFCEIYRSWRKKIDLVMRHDHKAGEKVFSDFAGGKLNIQLESGIQQARLFVCSLGASSYTFARLLWNEDSEGWCTGQALAFQYFGGTSEVVVPDNPKAVTAKACPFEPEINPSFSQMAAHFNVAVIPARVRKPRDKGSVESAVGVATRWILAALRNTTFHSLAEANEAVAVLLEKLNTRPFKKLPGCRRSRFEEIDKPALKPLPRVAYEYRHISFASVHIADYHVEYDYSWYSVPYQYRGRKVEIHASINAIEVFLRGKRIASHIRRFVRGSRITIREHRPHEHQQYGDWSTDKILAQAEASAGPNTKQVLERIIQGKPHAELAYKACLGIFRLGRQAGQDRLEAACKRAIAINACSYTSVKSIIDKGLDRRTLEEKAPPLKIVHENIRGAASFASTTSLEGDRNNADTSNAR
jgi:transposase